LANFPAKYTSLNRHFVVNILLQESTSLVACAGTLRLGFAVKRANGELWATYISDQATLTVSA
jgi:hypothetical protein